MLQEEEDVVGDGELRALGESAERGLEATREPLEAELERGRTQDVNLVVEQGLEEGEIVIVEGVQKIRPGVPVSPVFRDGGAQES